MHNQKLNVSRRALLGGASALALSTMAAAPAFAACRTKPGTGALGTGALGTGALGTGASTGKAIAFEARKDRRNLLGGVGPDTEIWGYNGQVPGPILRVCQGEELNLNLKNSLEQPTTIHWHGIRIDNKMDGVPDLTQDAVPPGGSFDYRFKLPDAGTFWYHPHKLSSEQVARGLHGLLIVDEPNGPQFDQDIPLVFDDWLLREDGQIESRSFGSIGTRAHGGRMGNNLTVNGSPRLDIPIRSGERLRIRLCSTANSRILVLRFENMNARIIAIDGQPIEPTPLPNAPFTIAPGQRVDLAVDMTGDPGSAAAISELSGMRLVAVKFNYHPTRRTRSNPLKDPVILPKNPLTPLKSNADIEVPLVMTGGAMGGLEAAIYQDKKLGLRELARQHGLVWALNGVAGMPKEPLFSAKLGQMVTIKMVNDTVWPHAMHLHGHHMKVISRTRNKSPKPYWRDIVLVERREEVTQSKLTRGGGLKLHFGCSFQGFTSNQVTMPPS